MEERSAVPKRAIIFDLDGTLLDTLADIGDSVNLMLADYGFAKHGSEAYRDFIGDGIRMIVTRALPEASRSEKMVDACLKRALEIYWENWNRKTTIYDGILPLLDALEEKKIAKAVLSNKAHEFTVKYIDYYFKGYSFAVVMGKRPAFPSKPDPAAALEIARRMGIEPSEFVLMGDSQADMKAARSAGMFAVGVDWGFKGTDELTNNGCQLLISHPMEVLPYF